MVWCKHPNFQSEDALEFSPIYQCFMEEKLFDHFTAACTDECGNGAVVARGQCALGFWLGGLDRDF